MATKEQYENVLKAARDYCEVAYNGARIRRDNVQLMAADWVRRYACKRCKSSKYAVAIKKHNYGTHAHIDEGPKIMLFDIERDRMKNDKGYWSAKQRGRVYDSDVIGYLS